METFPSKTEIEFFEIEALGFVDKSIPPNGRGRVAFQGSFWPAMCEQPVEIHQGTQVKIIGLKGVVLIVQPIRAASPNQIQATSPNLIDRVISRVSQIAKPSTPIESALVSLNNSSEESSTLEDLLKIALELDSGNARIADYQTAIDNLKQNTRQNLADLAEVIEKL